LNRRIILLNVALLTLAGALIWLLHAHRSDARLRETKVLTQQASAKSVLAPPPPPPVRPVAPSEYLDVAQKTLFSKDRNPTAIIEPPPAKPAKPEPPLPALPKYHGQMDLGEPVVFLSTGGDTQRGYHAGEEIGDFRIASFDQDKIAFEWRGRTVERSVADLAPKEEAPPAAPAAPRSGAASVARPATPLASPPVPDNKPDPALGDNMGGGFRTCVPGESAPAGTVIAGYKKVVSQTMFGQNCHWEPVQ
jgi:hypothetical protein